MRSSVAVSLRACQAPQAAGSKAVCRGTRGSAPPSVASTPRPSMQVTTAQVSGVRRRNVAPAEMRNCSTAK